MANLIDTETGVARAMRSLIRLEHDTLEAYDEAMRRVTRP
jgi:hypothetical protein